MWLQAVLAVSAVTIVRGKVYERCELARELVDKHEAPQHQVATWVCIAQHESQYNTSAVGHMNSDTSGDHGIFQISDLYWCSPPGNGWACGVTCAELEDDNIEDDFICAKRIYREHKQLSGNGFNAWVVYHTHCSGNVDSYIEGCFNQTANTTTNDSALNKLSSDVTTSTASSTVSSTTVTSTVKNEVLSRKFTSDPNHPWFIWFNKFKWN